MGVPKMMMKILPKICLVLHLSFLHVNAVCEVDLQNVGRGKLPLVLDRSYSDTDTDASTLLLPTKRSHIAAFNSQEEISLLCTGDENSFKFSGVVRQLKKINAECVSGTSFEVGEISYNLQDIECTQEHKAYIKNKGTCWEGFKQLQIGYRLPENKFLGLVDVCFDENTYKTAYVNYTLVEGIGKRHNNQLSNIVDQTDYFNELSSSLSSYYTCSNQQNMMNSVLKSSQLAARYIVCSNNGNYLVKSQLASSSDFVFEAEQISSHYYINTVPMWHSIKHGNWKNLEEEIRLYAANISRESSDLIIYTGTLEITTLPDDRGRDKQIYLGTKNGFEVMPVPKWIWKVVYEPSVKEGIVFILVNNPYRQRFASCTCVCPQTKWTIAWNRRDRKKGYIYCCTIPNFRRVFSGLPQFEVTGLLTKNRPYSAFDLDVIPQ